MGGEIHEIVDEFEEEDKLGGTAAGGYRPEEIHGYNPLYCV